MAARDASANIQIGVSGDIDSQLRNLSRKLQQNKISDILDLNVNQTQIDQQLLLLKRRIDAAHFSDMLSFDVNQTAIDQQLALIKRKMDAAKFIGHAVVQRGSGRDRRAARGACAGGSTRLRMCRSVFRLMTRRRRRSSMG